MSSGRPWACATPLIACSTRQSPGAVITRPVGAQAFDVGVQLRLQAAVVGGVVQPGVVQGSAGRVQGLREVAHRGQEHHRARLARPDMRRFLGHLGHPHRVVCGVEAVERGSVQVELVAQHEDQVAQFSVAVE